MRNGEFRYKNTLQATQRPSFKNIHQSPTVSISKPRVSTQESHTIASPASLPTQRRHFQKGQSHSWEDHQQSLQNIGDSSSLFDSNLQLDSESPGISVTASVEPNFKSTGKQNQLVARTMVNERSPAKAPLQPMEGNGQQIQQPQNTRLPEQAPLTSVPRFGETTLPQSPLNRKALESRVFIMPKPPRPEYRKEPQPQTTNHPHLHAAKDFVKGVVDPFLHRSTPAQTDNRYNSTQGDPVPIPRPSGGAAFTTTQPAPPKAFGSMGNTYSGFQTVNQQSRPANFIEFTNAGYRDRMAPAEPYTFVDPSKAAADLKALLEGAIEDDDDMPKTRLRKKRKDEKLEGLVAKLGGLAVTSEAANNADEDDEDEDDGTIDGIKVKLLPHQVEGLGWMRDRELGTRKKGTVPKGGILADDMGLGKTLQSIALILTNPKPNASELEDGKRKFPSGMEKCTLVVAPLALIRQWELEIKDKVVDSHQLRVCVHHGPQRTKRFQDLKKYDVVITTYQILVSEYGSSSNDADGLKVGCFGLHWYRVILDEAHTIKNRNAKATQACYNLRSEYRWCLTGTPMQNNLDELQSLIKFLRIKPYDDLKEWKDQIDRPMKNGRGDVAIKRLQHYLKIFMKRRTKDILKKEGALNPGGKVSAAGETSKMGFKVTERKIEKVFAQFSPEERLFYDRLEQRADKSLEEMMGGEKVNYASALVLLLRLRQACNHPKLVAGKLGKDGEALGFESSNGIQTQRKSKVSNDDIDEMADLFGGLGVESKKCDACGNDLSKELSQNGAIRCEDCEEDLQLVEKKRTHKKSSRPREKPEATVHKARNRAVVLDSDDENEGEWIVGEYSRGATTLGKAGGSDDENAEGEGISIGSYDSNDSEDEEGRHMGAKKRPKKQVIVLDESSQVSDSDTDSEVETELQSSSEEEAELATIITSTKITHLLKILGKEAAQHKFIVFSQFTSMLDLIEPFLKRDGYKYTRYDGSMKNDLREASLSRLRNDRSCRVLLCSLKCGSLGLNLTAATRVVILEPFWNPFVEEQAIDRVHRLTQTMDVVVYKITIQNSVEERILELQEKKRELANQAIEGGAKANAGKLGMKEILQLFRREAEHTPPPADSGTGIAGYGMEARPRVLGSGRADGEVMILGERRVSPAIGKPARKEDNIYGRRW